LHSKNCKYDIRVAAAREAFWFKVLDANPDSADAIILEESSSVVQDRSNAVIFDSKPVPFIFKDQ